MFISEVELSIRRYRARFCSEAHLPATLALAPDSRSWIKPDRTNEFLHEVWFVFGRDRVS